MVGCLVQRSRCSLMIGGIILSNSFGIIMLNHPYMFNHQNYWIYIYIYSIYSIAIFHHIMPIHTIHMYIYIWLIIQELGSNQVFIWMMEFEDLKIEKIISWTLQVSRWKRFGFPNGWMPCLSGWLWWVVIGMIPILALFISGLWIITICSYLGVSINGGTLTWMVHNGKSC